LAEVTVIKDIGKGKAYAIEVGWVVGPTLFHDGHGWDTPHLFVKATKGAQEATSDCWGDRFWQNPGECGWRQVSKTYYPNRSTLQRSSTQPFGIYYHQGNWWINYANDWIGYFEGKYWDQKFTSISHVQWYGEVEVVQVGSASKGDCTQMGSGYFPTDNRAAVITNMGLFDAKGVGTPAKAWPYVSDPQRYNIGGYDKNPFSSFSYGGMPCRY
jgi:hypothetical protein